MVGVWKANELQGTGVFQWELPYSNTPQDPKGAGSVAQTSTESAHAGGSRYNHQMVAVRQTEQHTHFHKHQPVFFWEQPKPTQCLGTMGRDATMARAGIWVIPISYCSHPPHAHEQQMQADTNPHVNNI